MRRRIEIHNSVEDLSRKAAGLFVAEAAAATATRGRFSVALSGGSTPGPFYSTLSTDKYRSCINWESVHFFWADERCVPKDHPDSNFKLAFELLLSKVPVQDSNIHRILGELGPERAANMYEKELRFFFRNQPLPRFDLICLGIGADGHTASIFPREKAANDSSRAAIPVYVEKLRSYRVSLTLPVINRAETVVFLVTGSTKASIVHEILEETSPGSPAAKVNPTMGKTIWLLDREAAELLAYRNDFKI